MTTPLQPASAKSSNLLRSEAQHRSASINVLHYDVDIDVRAAQDASTSGFGSTTTIVFTAAPGGSTFLDFIGQVHAVTLNGKTLDVGAAVTGARIYLDSLAEENSVTVVATALYSRSGEGMHRFVDSTDGQTYLYTQYEPADARRVFANFEQPDLKAPFTFHLTGPQGWVLASNGEAAQRTEVAPGVDRVDFAPTLPIATYITTLLAGPYHVATDVWRHPDQALTVPLALYCRASIGKDLDAAAIFEVTKSGLTFFNRLFDYPYPFGKYDQAFVPEYNLGAMENPGLVTFTEAYVFTSRATNTQYQGRANTIMHEMAHMWFGDLVTMRWWDDLWLKESFADYMGHLGVAQATQWGEQSWIQFADSRKSWAYLQDQLPTTHPIVADIVDLEAAKQNFDGITYAKGASALKQLVAYVGFEEFIAGARKYFRAHEFGNTTLPDLLAALGEASGRDLGRWSKAWLETSGPSTLSTKISADDGVITDVQILASSVDPVSGNEVDRPHRVRVGAYNFDSEGSLNRVKSVEVDVSGTSTRVPELNGMPRPALLLINDEDLSYAKIVLEDVSVNTAITSLSSVADPMARALVWSALWSQTRDGAMPAARFVAAVVAHAPAEENVGTLSNLLASARTAVLRYTSAAERAEIIATLLGAIVQQLRAAAPGSDTQLVWARNLALLSRSTDGAQGLIRDILAGTSSLSGLTVDSALRWLFLQALAATGGVDTEALAQELAADTTAPGHVGHRLAMSALPTDAAKAAAWEAALRDTKISNELLSATIEGFNLGPARLRTAYGEPYFREIEHVWSSQSIELASRIVRGLYPMDANLEQNYRPDEHPDILRSQAWLDAHGEAPAGLRRIIIEAQDHLLRALSAQQAAWRM